MKRFNKRKQYSIWMLAAFLLASCSEPKEEENDEFRLSQGKVDVTVSVTLPHPELVKALTRAAGDTDIKNMDLLVFDKDARFLKRVKVEDGRIKATASGVSFTVDLDGTAEKRIIHLVANGRRADDGTDRLNFNEQLKEGSTESAVISSLKTVAQPGGGGMYNADMTPPLMWGRFVLDNGTNVTAPITGVRLLRATAEIQLKFSRNIGFEGITVYQGSACGFLAPQDCTGTVSTTLAAGNPVTGSRYLDYNTALVKGREPSLYVYERNCTPDNYMSVIIQGIYKEKSGYYKVIMTDSDGTLLNIIRNHRYILTVTSVNSYGFENIESAIASPPSNALKVEVTNEDTDFPIIAADGHNMLALSNNAFIAIGSILLYPDSYFVDLQIYGNVEICRLYYGPDAPIEEVTCIEDTEANGLWQVVSDGGGYYRITGNIPGHSFTFGSVPLIIRAGNLSIPFKVTWITNPDNTTGYDLVNSADKNWNVRVINQSSLEEGGGLYPSTDRRGGRVSELSSKYNSHAYVHIPYTSQRANLTLLKSSVSGGKPMVTKISASHWRLYE